MVGDIVEGLLRKIGLDLREILLRRMLDTPAVPGDLLSRIGEAPIDHLCATAADPQRVGGEDLIRIADQKARQYRLSLILKRSHRRALILGEAEVETDVVEALRATGDAELAGAATIYLGYQTLLDAGMAPSLHPDELGADLLRRICWRMAAALRVIILDEFDIDATALDDRIEEAVLELMRRSGDPGAGPHSPSSPVCDLAETLADRDLIGPKLLVRVLQQGHVDLFEQLFCRLLHIRRQRLQRALSDASGRALAVLCRAASFDPTAFAAVYLIHHQGTDGVARNPKALAAALKVFHSTIARDAHQLMRQWRRDPVYVEAIEEFGRIRPH